MKKVEVKISHPVLRALGIILGYILICLIGLAFMLLFFKMFLGAVE